VETDVYDIVVVKYGSRVARRSEVFLHHAATGTPDAEIGMDYFFWIVRNTDRTFLVDTGFAAATGRRRGRTVHADPLELATELAAGPADAPEIIVTHAHYDHIGNLAAYADSRILIARDELAFSQSPMATRGEFGVFTEAEELRALGQADRDGRVIAIDDGFEPAPGIRLLVVGGHTPGQLMVEVATAHGTVLLAADALHYTEELERDLPFINLADLAQVYAAFDLIRDAERAGTRVIAGHDPAVLGAVGSPLPTQPDLTATISAASLLERTPS
jgi:glyoxylase-like metal-dependent hydrolase (beta-lactamase superfamily II)